MSHNTKGSRGFTLIELVVVITLLGILSAVALPKFSNITGSAYTAVNQGVGGSLTSAVYIAHSAWLAAGNTGTTIIPLEPCIVQNLNNIYMNATGWPGNGATCTTYPCTCAAAGAPASNTSASNTECVNIWLNLMNNPPPVTAGTTCTGKNCYGAVGSATAQGTCTYTLGGTGGTVPAPNRQIIYQLTTGTITVTP
jgi:MSHA pilin protein MshB